MTLKSPNHVTTSQDTPEFWISREDYLEEGVACLSKCGQAWGFICSVIFPNYFHIQLEIGVIYLGVNELYSVISYIFSIKIKNQISTAFYWSIPGQVFGFLKSQIKLYTYLYPYECRTQEKQNVESNEHNLLQIYTYIHIYIYHYLFPIQINKIKSESQTLNTYILHKKFQE